MKNKQPKDIVEILDELAHHWDGTNKSVDGVIVMEASMQIKELRKEVEDLNSKLIYEKAKFEVFQQKVFNYYTPIPLLQDYKEENKKLNQENERLKMSLKLELQESQNNKRIIIK